MHLLYPLLIASPKISQRALEWIARVLIFYESSLSNLYQDPPFNFMDQLCRQECTAKRHLRTAVTSARTRDSPHIEPAHRARATQVLLPTAVPHCSSIHLFFLHMFFLRRWHVAPPERSFTLSHHASFSLYFDLHFKEVFTVLYLG